MNLAYFSGRKVIYLEVFFKCSKIFSMPVENNYSLRMLSFLFTCLLITDNNSKKLIIHFLVK